MNKICSKLSMELLSKIIIQDMSDPNITEQIYTPLQYVNKPLFNIKID